MFWVSVAKPPYPVTIHTAVRENLTISAQTDRVIRIPSPLGRASDHRSSQVESGLRTDYRSRVNLQRDKRYRVHVRVSVAQNETFLPCLFINSLETPTGIGMRKTSGPAVWHGTWDSAVLGVSYSRERSGIALEGYSDLASDYLLDRLKFTAHDVSPGVFEKAYSYFFSG